MFRELFSQFFQPVRGCSKVNVNSPLNSKLPCRINTDRVRTICADVSRPPLQVHGGRLPAQEVLPHPLPDADASDARLLQDAHLHVVRLPTHSARPGPHPVAGGGQLPHAASATDAAQLRFVSSLQPCAQSRMAKIPDRHGCMPKNETCRHSVDGGTSASRSAGTPRHGNDSSKIHPHREGQRWRWTEQQQHPHTHTQ